MKFPFVLRRDYDEVSARVLDLEKHFVTKRGPAGEVVETLADVPLKERKERKAKLQGMTMQQRKQWMEATDGGRLIATKSS